ncbi:hypothetical protein HHJ49_19290 [Escherichia coli]|nr:hypothetical protein HHJ49_19290 [Escherichia coli]
MDANVRSCAPVRGAAGKKSLIGAFEKTSGYAGGYLLAHCKLSHLLHTLAYNRFKYDSITFTQFSSRKQSFGKMIRSTRISLGLFFNYFLSLTKIDLGQNYISLPSIKSSTHIALLFMVSMGTQKLKAQGFFIFSLLLTLILFCITTLYNENTNVKLIPQMNYLMVVVALFFP